MAEPDGPAVVRVVVADDQDIVRDGLVTVLSLLDDVEVVGQAVDGHEAVALALRLRPDLVLMDLRMPGLDGVGATAVLAERAPEVGVLVLTTYADDASIARALSAGARGFLTKDASRHDIAAALRSVARGQATFDARISARLVAGLPVPTDVAPPPDRRLAGLTAREREVLTLIGLGRSNTEIADELVVSTATVKTHINNLFAKLALRDRAQAVRLALEIARTDGA